MSAEMRRRRSSWFVRQLSAVFVLLPAPARAADDSVTVTCDALTTDEIAELDARTRSTLLADGPEGTQLRVRCEPDLATVLAVTGEHSESAVVRLPQPTLKDALLAAVEQTLAATKEHLVGASVASPAVPRPDPLPPPLPAPLVEVPSSPTDLAVATKDAPRPRPVRIGASALFEPWDDKPAFGGRARVEVAFQPLSIALALGGLTSAERASSFVPTEWHALALAAIDFEERAGLRLSAAAGVSMLLASPSGGLANQSGTSVTTALFELGFSRPFHVGRFAVTPELALRLFSSRREVRVDGQVELSLPVVSPLVSLTTACEL